MRIRFTSPCVRLLCFVALAVAACDDGGGGTAQRFFGMNNRGPCSSITVTLDLETAQTVLARQDDGAVDCALDTLLAQDGCQVSFDEAVDGSTLTVTIDGCQITESTLFRCGFHGGALTALNASTDAACACATEPICHLNGATCYTVPGICVSEDSAAHDCETCFDGDDNDGDGKVDCDDGDCFVDCGVGLTTVTCSSTTTSTTASD
jgi:hypothetical protein